MNDQTDYVSHIKESYDSLIDKKGENHGSGIELNSSIVNVVSKRPT